MSSVVDTTLRQDPASRPGAPGPVPPAPPGLSEPGSRTHSASRIGRYAILRTLGEGGMGVVFAAYDEELDRKVAVKLLRDGGSGQPEQRLRIQREAQAMARVAHPNVVAVYEVGEHEGRSTSPWDS